MFVGGEGPWSREHCEAPGEILHQSSLFLKLS